MPMRNSVGDVEKNGNCIGVALHTNRHRLAKQSLTPVIVWPVQVLECVVEIVHEGSCEVVKYELSMAWCDPASREVQSQLDEPGDAFPLVNKTARTLSGCLASGLLMYASPRRSHSSVPSTRAIIVTRST